VALALSGQPEGPFAFLEEPLVPSDANEWTRPASSELIAYPSAVPPTGGQRWSSSFFLFHMYIEPEKEFEKRYLLRRKVQIEEMDAPVSGPQVFLVLKQSQDPTNDQTYWATTAYSPGYTENYEELGYVLTKPPEGVESILLLDCYYSEMGDHLLKAGGQCSDDGYTELRIVGWLYTGPEPDTQPLYLCSVEDAQQHYVSKSKICPDGSNGELLGYIPIIQ
jgi:hypothetical protein